MIFFATERLVVRNWKTSDVEALYALYNDPDVMRHFPGFVDRDRCIERVARWKTVGETRGLTFAPLVPVDGPDEMIGFAGLLPIENGDLPRPSEHEIGWTLSKAFWRRGYAREAARGWIAHAFGPLDLERLSAFVAEPNRASQAVAESVGMVRVANGDFEHPNVPDGRLRRHRLYEITRS